MKSELTCPNCKVKTSVDVPQTSCLAFYQCSGCEQIVGTPKDGGSCCVVCAYSESTCPLPTKLKEKK